MKRKVYLIAGLIGAGALAAALALPVTAHGPGSRWHDDDGERHERMGPWMKRMPGDMGPGMMGMMERFDADKDGTVTPEEAREGLAGLLAEFDADADGSLDLSEFQALHASVTRPRMVDRFQALDEDGDGKVTAEEMSAPAQHVERMERRRERMRRHHRMERTDE